MRRDLVEHLCCPVDEHFPLALSEIEAVGVDVLNGALVCSGCGRWFMIRDGVAHLVRDGLRHVEEELDFLDRYAESLPKEASGWKPYGVGADI